MTPTAVLMVERPRTNASAGSTSDISAMALPAVADITSHGIAISTKRQPHARSGSACSRLVATMTASTRTSAWRGRIRSDSASSSDEPSSRTSGPPNMLSAVRIGEPVAAYMIVPSARLATEPDITMKHWDRNRTRNSETENSWRYVFTATA